MRRLPLLVLALLLPALAAAEPTKLLRFPDVYGDQVAFCYAGDIWKASIKGGSATRLTAHPGVEVFPRFSPDGKWIAFTGQYDGDEQVYVIPSDGGEPKQLTWYPAHGPLAPRWGYDNIVYGWTPDGSSILFRSLRYGYAEHPGHLYTVKYSGGPAIPLPMPRAGAGDYSPDGNRMIYSPLWRDFRTWKRYEGGWAQDLYIYDLKTNATKIVSPTKRTERDPMWIGDAIFFVSDRTGTLNVFKYDVKSEAVTQVTKSDTWDVRWASSDGKATIVFEAGGEIHVLEAASGKENKIDITVPDDGLWDRPSRVSAAGNVEDYDLSPKGERALFTARGDIFTAPIENGPTRNLTRTSNAHDRASAWSPDGKTIVYISDATGEEEIYTVPQDGSAKPKQLTKGNKMRLFRPAWSGDGKRIAYGDKEGRLWVIPADGGTSTQVADERNFRVTDYVWSADGQWLAYSLTTPTTNRALWIWGVADGKARQVTEGFFGEHDPSWDPEGKYLWYLSEREFQPQFSQSEWNFATNRMTSIYALTLRKDVADPFAPLSDEVKLEDEKKDDAKKDDAKKDDKKDEKKDEGKKAKEPIKIDFDGLGSRVSRCPLDADNYDGLTALKGTLVYVRRGAAYYGRDSEAKPAIKAYDLEKRKESTMVENAGSYAISWDGKKILVLSEGAYTLYDVPGASKDSKKTVSTSGLMVDRIPREEWRNAFNEVWRRYRDFFYAENMHGYDWEALRKQYASLVEQVGHRSDLNYVLGEMVAELSVGHAYIDGGDWQKPTRAPVGLLGARIDWDPSAKKYRIGKIWKGQNEEPRYRSPLTEIGVDVKEGDVLIAIDGEVLSPDRDPYALLVNKTNPITLTLGGRDGSSATHTVKVNPIRDEGSLIYLDWTERNRAYVDKATNGRVAYMHIPNMGADGAREFVKWFYPQATKAAMIVDDRANGGGNISAWVIERLRRKVLGTEYARTSEDATTYPDKLIRGPMVCLISETSASDGDIFPYSFREAGLGPLIGKRTWGGVVGISGLGPLIDGGGCSVPQFDNLSKDGKHVMEGVGVSPDIEVDNDPASEIAGKDKQLDRAIEEIENALAKEPHDLPKRPADPVKTKSALK
ncbi:MAG TPA: S41 family peptidase [Candidatus Polarisedimenticolaceae bacterium]|nr:S41 family peptidase [Candidatus Polarisedimenticolaceae bacterium]